MRIGFFLLRRFFVLCASISKTVGRSFKEIPFRKETFAGVGNLRSWSRDKRIRRQIFEGKNGKMIVDGKMFKTEKIFRLETPKYY